MDKNRILSRKNVRNLIICSLFVGVNCAANKSKFDLKQNLLEQKTPSFILSLFPWMLEIWIWFWGSMPQTPLENVDHWPLVDTVGYSIQTCCLLQFSLKPLLLMRMSIRRVSTVQYNDAWVDVPPDKDANTAPISIELTTISCLMQSSWNSLLNWRIAPDTMPAGNA